jgi:hypothetical protein
VNAMYQNRGATTQKMAEAAHLQSKVEQDVIFLTNRIEMMKKNNRPNQNVLETYETMLRSRKAVLAWLYDGKDAG